MDYYMLMKNAKAEDRQFVGERLNAFGLRKTAGAVMWLMEKLFSLTREEMLCPPDKRRGKWMLDKISSALDEDTERQLFSRLLASRPDTTMLLITHRQNVASICDDQIKLL